MNTQAMRMTLSTAEAVPEAMQDAAAIEAGRRNLERTLQALLREGLLPVQHLAWRSSACWLPLQSHPQPSALRLEGFHIGRIFDCRLDGKLRYYAAGRPPQEILSGAQLLSCVASSLAGNLSPAALRRVLRELENSADNEALCLRHRRLWAEELRATYCAAGIPFLAALRRSSHPNPSLLLEQWGAVGHPWHPMSKTRLGLTPQEVIALSPEFGAMLRLPLAALRRDCAHLEAVAGLGDYADWFAQHFPRAWRDWLQALAAAGHKSHAGWLPLALHPYQAQHLVPREFAAEIEAGELLLLGSSMPAAPTMSFRTVVPDGSAAAPHLKLPVSLRLTSVQRAVSPKIATMGPRFTALLQQVLQRERHFGGSLDIIPEYLGLYYAGPAASDERSRHLSLLMRGNPMDQRSAELFPLPVGALFADSPADGKPIALELARLCGGAAAAPAAALDYFRRHAATVLDACLGAYLLYGLGFEAHQQNSFMLLDREWRPARLLLRDFGDLRVHMPTLRRAGLDLKPYSAGHACFEDERPVRDKLLHAVLLCHLGELGLLLARSCGQPEDGYWSALRQQVAAVFERLQPRVPPQRWQAERQALLEEDWPVKSFLRMRLMGTSEDLHGRMRNPLRDSGHRVQ